MTVTGSREVNFRKCIINTHVPKAIHKRSFCITQRIKRKELYSEPHPPQGRPLQRLEVQSLPARLRCFLLIRRQQKMIDTKRQQKTTGPKRGQQITTDPKRRRQELKDIKRGQQKTTDTSRSEYKLLSTDAS